MLELTINDKVYQFRFGMGFMREINKTLTQTASDNKNAKKNIGAQWKIAGIIDKDVEDLSEVLLIANKTETPRVTQKELDIYFDDDNTDINALFDTVLDFLENANATKNVVANLKKSIEKERAKSEKVET